MYYLHIIDEFSRFSQAGIVRSKKTSEIIDVLSQKWISVFGCPSLIFSDNGGEFCSKEFEDWTQNFNIEHKTSAAYSPFSNGIVERHNAVISLMMLKLVEEFPNTKVDTILSWACSAKNSLSTVAGFSPNQLMFGTQTYLPNVLNSSPPALENETSSKVVASHINAMNASRRMFLSCESSNRIMKALKKPLRTYTAPVTFGSKVYYKAVGSDKWKGPATVIGQDSTVVFLRQGSFVTRVHQSRISLVKDQVPYESKSDSTNGPIQDVESIKEASVLRIPDLDCSSDHGSVQEVEVEPSTNPVAEVNCPAEIEAESPTSLTEIAEKNVQVSQLVNNTVSTKEDQRIEKPTAIKRGSTIIFVDDGTQYEAVVLSRAGKANGKLKNWYNVHVKETNEVISIDVSTIDDFTVLNKDEGDEFDFDPIEDVYAVQLDDYATEKQLELSSWVTNKVYEEVRIGELDARKVITSTWVCKQNGDTKKARLVARGFLEDTSSIISDSPTCCKESLRLLLAIIAGKNWIVQALDIKSAFLQGNDMMRPVYMKPPKEAKVAPEVIWKLKKCVYGLVDASLKWYQRVADCLIDFDGVKSKDPAVFYWRKDGDLAGVLALHVDDFMYAGSAKFLEEVMTKVKSEFLIKIEEKSAFTYLGLEIRQKAYYIEMDQKKYIEKLCPIDIPGGALKTRDLSSDEKNTLKSKLGQILWVSNHSRPDVSFQVCVTSTGIKDATVKDFHDCNQVIERLKRKHVCIKHHSLGNLKNLKFILFSDASHKNLYNGASQGGYVVFIKSDDSQFATPLIWCSKKLKRIVRSTLFAETYALLEAIDSCIFLRRMTSQLLNIEDIKTLCDSIVSNKLNEDKRLRHEIECLKETVKLDNIDVHWISNKLQVANVFTKAGAPTNLILEVLDTGVLRFG